MGQDGHHHLVIDSPGQVQVVWYTLNSERKIIIKDSDNPLTTL